MDGQTLDFRNMSDSLMPPGTSASVYTSTATTISINNKQQHSFDPRTNNGRNTSSLSVGPSNDGQDDSRDDNSDFSELEEGEIIERALPAEAPTQPPVSKPLPLHPPFSRRPREPPPPRPSLGSLPYRFSPDLDKSSGQPLFPPIISNLHYSTYTYSPFQQSHTPDPLPPVDVEQGPNYLQAQQLLEDLLAMGLTNDDLIAEGMHPEFLNQLYARIKLQSHTHTSPRTSSIPPSTGTPDPPQAPQQLIPIKPIAQHPTLIADVDNFLDNLVPSISTPNGSENSKKRGLSSDNVIHPPKRRAFGLAPPTQLVIDVSDDEDEDEDDEDDGEEKKDENSTPAPVIKPPPRPVVRIPERPPLTQQDVVKALRNRELAIEAMKRKIEAKMRGNGSHDSIAQQIAVSIVDNNDDSSANSPLVQSPESTRDQWNSNLNSPSNNAPMPRSEDISPVSMKECSAPILASHEHLKSPIAMIQAPASPSIPPNQAIPAEDSTMEDDEEASLLAELEAERVAEEKARQKRRELEERLASARGKKPQQTSTKSIPERGGDGGNIINPAQDIGPSKKGEWMVIENVAETPTLVDSGDEDIAIVDNEDRIVKDHIAINEMEVQPLPTNVETPQTNVNVRHEYQSPLRIFGSFRFHPHYLFFVPVRGFRSLTYSNHIQSGIMLCRYELSGGVCNDANCKYQHFKTIILSGSSPFLSKRLLTREDQDIIKDMMNTVIGEIPSSQQNEFREDLRGLLKEVGEQSGGDFQSLALTLVQLRNSRLERFSHIANFS